MLIVVPELGAEDDEVDADADADKDEEDVDDGGRALLVADTLLLGLVEPWSLAELALPFELIDEAAVEA